MPPPYGNEDDWVDDDGWVDDVPSDINMSMTGQPEEMGAFGKTLDFFTKERFGQPRAVADWITKFNDDPRLATSPTGEGGIADQLKIWNAMYRGWASGALYGLGDYASKASSIADMGSTLLGMGGNVAAAKGAIRAGRNLAKASNVLNVPGAIHGGQTILDPNASTGDKLFGTAELLGNVAGMASPLPGAPPAKAKGGGIPENLDEIPSELFDEVLDDAPGGPQFVPPNAPVLRGPASQTRNLPLTGGAARNIAKAVAGQTTGRKPNLEGAYDLGDIAQYEDLPAGVMDELEAPIEAPMSPMEQMRMAEVEAAIPEPPPISPDLMQQKLPLEPVGPPPPPPFDPIDSALGQDQPFNDGLGNYSYQSPRGPDVLGDIGQRSIDFERGAPMAPEQIDPFLGQNPTPQGPPTTFDFPPMPPRMRGMDQISAAMRQAQPPVQKPVLPGEFGMDMFGGMPPPRGGPPPTPPPQGHLLPPEFAQDVRMTQEPVMGGTSPVFRPAGEQLTLPEAQRMLTEPPRMPEAARTLNFKPKNKRQAHEVTQDIENVLLKPKNEATDVEYSRLMEEAEQVIGREMDPEIIRDNFNILEDWFQAAKYDSRFKAPRTRSDMIEAIGSLRDTALERHRALGEEPLKATDKGYYPQGMRTAEGRFKVDADVESLGAVLGSSLYKGESDTVATKEMLQNAIDAIRKSGSSGKVSVDFDTQAGQIHMEDNGGGMTPDEMSTYLIDLGASGKRDIAEASGGFGLAKAAIILGGKKTTVTSIAIDPSTGQKISTSITGTPQQFLKEGVMPDIKVVDPNTPTGTKFTFEVDPGEMIDAREFMTNVGRYSKIEGQVQMRVRKHGDAFWDVNDRSQTFEDIGTQQTPSGDLHFSIPPDTPKGTKYFGVVINNNGIFQSMEWRDLGRHVMGIPDKVVVDVKAKVPEGHTDYPFVANREGLRGSVDKAVAKYVQEEIINPALKKSSAELGQVYESMPAFKGFDGENIYVHDTGSRYTPEELKAVMTDPVMQSLGEQIGHAVRVLKGKFAHTEWADKVEGVGFVFDDALEGLFLPHPSKGTSRILINPLVLMKNNLPDEAAAGFSHAILHEFAHVDPSTVVHGEGHTENFTINLAKIDKKYGAAETLRSYDEFLKAVTDPNNPEGYSPDVQRLLQGYTSSRGRPVVKEDILSRTGFGSKTSGEGQTGIPGGARPDGERTFIIRNPDLDSVKKAAAQGYVFVGANPDGSWRFKKGRIPLEAGGSQGPPILETEVGQTRPRRREAREQLGPDTNVKQTSNWVEAYNLARGLKASLDISAPFRQGIGLIHKKEFWKAFKPMFQSWASEEGFQAAQKAISDRALFRARVGRDGKMLPSFAADAGLHLTDLKDLSTREENIASTWAENAGYVEGKSRGIPGVSKAYAGTIGRGVRASNRAYTAFLNTLRADVFENLVKNGKVFGADAKVDITLARALANFTNVASGRGSLGPLESSAKILGLGMFSPRLAASRLKMLDPRFYVTGPKQARMEAIKSLFAITAAGNIITQLGSLIPEADVDNDPNSSDFGKVQIGNTRIDPYAGFQQYIVAANRLIRPNWAAVPGAAEANTGIVPLDNALGMAGTGGQQIRSTLSGNQYDLWNQTGPYDPTHLSTITRFARGKAHPMLGLAFDILGGMKDMTGKPLDFKNMNPMENTIAQQFIPLFAQDLYEVSQQNPELLPLTAPLSALGMGVQSYSEEDR